MQPPLAPYKPLASYKSSNFLCRVTLYGEYARALTFENALPRGRRQCGYLLRPRIAPIRARPRVRLAIGNGAPPCASCTPGIHQLLFHIYIYMNTVGIHHVCICNIYAMLVTNLLSP